MEIKELIKKAEQGDMVALYELGDCYIKGNGVKIDFAKMGYDDPAVYEMIASGNTSGTS